MAAKALDYPRFTVWVLDDGKRDWLRDLCAERSVEYVRRPDNKHAKAGNVNHAFGITKGELFAVFDADFTPHRSFLYRTVGFFFADPHVTIVQTPQHFFNADVFQLNLGLSDVMQDNEREWYDAILASRDAWDRAFCCGTSAVFRRDALQRIGGIATDSITEDILTTVRMLPDGYVTRYLNERLSLGLAPEDVKSLLIQRRRWARGSIQLMFLMLRRFREKLTFRDWVFFFPLHYLLDFPCRILFALLPLVYLWTGCTHFYVKSTAELMAYQGPTLIAAFLLGRWLIPHARAPLLSAATSLYLSARIYPAVISALIKPFGEPFRVTPKGKKNVAESGDRPAFWGLVALIVATIGGIIVGCKSTWSLHSRTGLIIATCWSLCNLVLFGLTLLAVMQRASPRQEERFPAGCRSALRGGGAETWLHRRQLVADRRAAGRQRRFAGWRADRAMFGRRRQSRRNGRQNAGQPRGHPFRRDSQRRARQADRLPLYVRPDQPGPRNQPPAHSLAAADRHHRRAGVIVFHR